MAKTKKVQMTTLAAGLDDLLKICWTTVETRRLGWESSQELMRLFAGFYVLRLLPLLSEHDAERRAVNAVLRSRIGLGYSWYACLSFLSGARAKAVFAKHSDVVREVGGSEMMLILNQVMPTLLDVISKSTVQNHERTRTGSPE